MFRALLSAVVFALVFSMGSARASGVERGSVPAEVGAIMGVPAKVRYEAEQVIRNSCNLEGVERAYAQDFTTDVVSDKAGSYNTHYAIEYTVYFRGASYVKSIVVNASVHNANGRVTIDSVSSDLCNGL